MVLKKKHFLLLFTGGDGTYYLKVLVPGVAAGAIIGKGGETIAQLQKDTGARVKMSKSHDFYPGEDFFIVTFAQLLCCKLRIKFFFFLKLKFDCSRITGSYHETFKAFTMIEHWDSFYYNRNVAFCIRSMKVLGRRFSYWLIKFFYFFFLWFTNKLIDNVSQGCESKKGGIQIRVAWDTNNIVLNTNRSEFCWVIF